jgi:hypothetical protein
MIFVAMIPENELSFDVSETVISLHSGVLEKVDKLPGSIHVKFLMWNGNQKLNGY